MTESKIPLIAVVGPTASGKTRLAVGVCERIGGEIVSCDSMQVYKGLDIASAKPSEEERRGIPRHLTDFLEPNENYNVARYCRDAKAAIMDIISRGKRAVLEGGTGLYYSSLTENIEFPSEKTDFKYRETLKERAEKEGAGVLMEELKRVDPESAKKLAVNDAVRIIRALEIYRSGGRTKTELDALSKRNPSPFDVSAICLDARDRRVLYDRIDRRVDAMLQAGLLREAEAFFNLPGSAPARRAIGCKEFYPYFRGESGLTECAENLKKQTRRYAKRQLTWFRRDPRMNFLYIDDYEGARPPLEAALEIIERGARNEK